MKILWAKSGGLLPLDSGGRIRSYHIATELARRHAVSAFTFYSALTPDPHVGFREPFADVEYVPLELAERGSVPDLLSFAANALTLKPYQMRKYCGPQVQAKLRQNLERGKYDVLLCDFLLAAAAVPWDFPIPKIIFTHNVEAAIWRRHFEVSGNPLWRLMAWREFKAWERAERGYTEQADHVLTVSDEDRRAFVEFLPPDKVTTIPTGVDLSFFQPAATEATAASVVFTGDMSWLPNEDALLYFCAEILPLVQQRIPDVVVWVVGRKPTKKVQALADNPSVRVTGFVDDIRPYVHQAAAYIVPLRIGGGTRIKIFEAMAMGMAVVSTAVGAEGLPVQHGENVLLADDPAAFAAETVRVLQDGPLRRRLGLAARELVQSRYSWAAVTDILDRVVEKLAAGRGRAPDPPLGGPGRELPKPTG